jgi:hypothetical protein
MLKNSLFRLWKEHDYKNGRIVITSCTLRHPVLDCSFLDSYVSIPSAMSATIANKDSTQCFYNPSKVSTRLLLGRLLRTVTL